jgi:hypothetical protein
MTSERDDLFAQVASDPSWATEAILQYRIQLAAMISADEDLKERVNTVIGQMWDIPRSFAITRLRAAIGGKETT